MGRNKGKFYVQPEELTEEIRKFKNNPDEDMTDKLGAMLIKIATKYASMPNYSGYSYKEDFIGDAILRMVQQIHKIDLDHPKCNPFFYLSITCYHVFISKITREKQFENAKNKLCENFFNEFEREEGINTMKRGQEKK